MEERDKQDERVPVDSDRIEYRLTVGGGARRERTEQEAQTGEARTGASQEGPPLGAQRRRQAGSRRGLPGTRVTICAAKDTGRPHA